MLKHLFLQLPWSVRHRKKFLLTFRIFHLCKIIYQQNISHFAIDEFFSPLSVHNFFLSFAGTSQTVNRKWRMPPPSPCGRLVLYLFLWVWRIHIEFLNKLQSDEGNKREREISFRLDIDVVYMNQFFSLFSVPVFLSDWDMSWWCHWFIWYLELWTLSKWTN